jgi:hypothetical protein
VLARRGVARARVKEPLRILIKEPWCLFLRREALERVDRVSFEDPPWGSRGALVVQAFGLGEGVRGGPIGVVKLLRARGGCLGVIRIRAWKAAICPGELPNER